MKKILIFIISILFFYSFIFAENDIKKLSKKDREQCKKMESLYAYYSNNYHLYSKWYQKKIKANFKIYKNKYLFKKFIFYNQTTSNDGLGLLAKGENFLGIFISIYGENFGIYYIQKGYLIDFIDYFHYYMKKENKKEYINGYGKVILNSKNFNELYLIKNKPKKDISYIKINNCRVEEIYDKKNKLKFQKIK